MNILLLLSHSIEEYDQVKLLSGLGYDTFSIGAYTDPANPGDDKRPPLPDVPYHRDLALLCERQRQKHEGEDASYVIDWAKGDLHPELVDWADVVIVHHFEQVWIPLNWDKLARKRVIWRTVGQSMPANENRMGNYRAKGLEIVRYSPKERNLRPYAGEDALIRFYKDPDEWAGWTGSDPVVGNITQHLAQRGDATHGDFWLAATQGLPTKPAGPGSEALPGGIGPLDYDAMRAYLRDIRCYLYTGTQPASYTLGLIEAMMTGVPVVSIGPSHMDWYPGLFEAHEIAATDRPGNLGQPHEWSDSPAEAGLTLSDLLNSDDMAREWSRRQREYAIDLFSPAVVGDQWRAFLGPSNGRPTDLDRIFWPEAAA